MKRIPHILHTLTGLLCLTFLFTACKDEVNKPADCNATDGTYICFNGQGNEATIARWNFDTAGVVKTLNIQGSWPVVPGTEGPWTTINITAVNTFNVVGIETGIYQYKPTLANDSTRSFTFWAKHYTGDDQNPDITNYVHDPVTPSSLELTSFSGGQLSGIFYASVLNPLDSTQKGIIKYRFTGIEPF